MEAAPIGAAGVQRTSKAQKVTLNGVAAMEAAPIGAAGTDSTLNDMIPLQAAMEAAPIGAAGPYQPARTLRATK